MPSLADCLLSGHKPFWCVFFALHLHDSMPFCVCVSGLDYFLWVDNDNLSNNTCKCQYIFFVWVQSRIQTWQILAPSTFLQCTLFLSITGTFKCHSSSFFSYVFIEPITVCWLLTLSYTVITLMPGIHKFFNMQHGAKTHLTGTLMLDFWLAHLKAVFAMIGLHLAFFLS